MGKGRLTLKSWPVNINLKSKERWYHTDELILVKNLFNSQKDHSTVNGNNHPHWKSPSWPFSHQWYDSDIITAEVLAGWHHLLSNNTKLVTDSQLKETDWLTVRVHVGFPYCAACSCVDHHYLNHAIVSKSFIWG